jgi:Flp pilus assembly protein TadD
MQPPQHSDSNTGPPGLLSTVWQSRLTLLLIVVTAGAMAAWFAWRCTWDDAIRFLPADGPADWIVYPVPASPVSHSAIEQTAVFRRSFRLEAVPAEARLQVRAYGQCLVTLNGVPVSPEGSPAASWKQPRTWEVARQLRSGDNDIAVTVSNSLGPPALWLVLWTGADAVVSDGSWTVTLAGAVPQGARPAALPLEPDPDGPLTGGEQCVASLRACWPILLLLAVLSSGMLAALGYWRRRRASHSPGQEIPSARALMIGVAVLWVLLFGNDLSSLRIPVGFDANAHLEYIRYVQERGALPLADEGREMFQPPLYYVVSAGTLRLCGVTASENAAPAWLRLLTLAAGIAQVALVFASLRLLFPGEPRKQGVGLLLAAFLPAHLYLYQYVTNEALAATLQTAAVYVCLRVLREEQRPVAWHALLGVCLGAALLTKVTALVVTAVVLAVLAGRLVVRRQWDPRIWLRTLAVTGATCLAVSGWHYARVWAHFGTPLRANYDPDFGWWQDPGYGTSTYLLGFGRSLTRPFFSAFHGFGDGVYSTLWGDGLCGGATGREFGPPWNYNLMAAGYLLALVPTALVLLGAAVAVIRLVRRPSADRFLLVGLAFFMGCALVYHFVEAPYVSCVKAFFGLGAAVPLCAFGACGFDLLARRGRWAGIVLAVALGAWALTAYTSFWIRGGAPDTQAWLGRRLTALGRLAEADRCFQQALHGDPDHVLARLGLAESLRAQGRTMEAGQELEHALQAHPDDARLHVLLAEVCLDRGLAESAERHAQRAIELDAREGQAYGLLGLSLNQRGRLDAAAVAYRQGLSLTPDSWALRNNLAIVLAKQGAIGEAIDQYRQALRLRPDEPGILKNLAWLLATQANPDFRDGPEAVRLAERACALTRHRQAPFLDTLAAAYAEAGRFDEAQETLRKAMPIAAESRRDDLVREMADRLKLYEARRAYRTGPPARDPAKP